MKLSPGNPIHLVQQTLGHTSVATTGRYLHARGWPGYSQSEPERRKRDVGWTGSPAAGPTLMGSKPCAHSSGSGGTSVKWVGCNSVVSVAASSPRPLWPCLVVLTR